MLARVAHPLHQSVREREREKKREREREREKERERERKRRREYSFLTGMMGALAPFSYLGRNIGLGCRCFAKINAPAYFSKLVNVQNVL